MPPQLQRRWLWRAMGALRALGASPYLDGRSLAELMRERMGGHPVDEDHGVHLAAALSWLERAQDSRPDDGLSRGYALTWNAHFRLRGWQPSYPETTGYIIPTLFEAARRLDRPELAARAVRAARWESAVQLDGGAVQGGVIGQPISPAAFNTGQVIFGWLAALEETGESTFEASIHRAASFLVDHIDGDGIWRRAGSAFADRESTLYNTRTGWALAEAGARFGVASYKDAAAKALAAAVSAQQDDGWFPRTCLDDPERPLLHTIAYTIRGLLEGGRVLEDPESVARARRAAKRLAELTTVDGRLAGRFGRGWQPAVQWSCLTGQAQMVNVWLRLYDLTGESAWLEPAAVGLRFLKSTQNRISSDGGLRGGIKGSFPLTGTYGRMEVLSWATKFFADALLRESRLRSGAPSSTAGVHLLA